MKRLLLTATVALILYTSFGCAQARFNLRWKNKLAPDFQLTSLNGGKTRLSEFRGKPVLLTFWGFG